MNNYEWLKNLVVGSKVFVSGREDFLVKVTKITATKIEVEGFGRGFRTDDGREKGNKDSWNFHRLLEATTERLAEHGKKWRRQLVARTNWYQDGVSDDQILAIYSILQAKKS